MFPTLNSYNVRGTREIKCVECHEVIATVSAETFFGSALCVVCQEAAKGNTLPPHVIAQIRSGTTDVTYSDIGYDPLTEKHLNQEEDDVLINSTQYWFKTVRVKIAAAINSVLLPKPKKPKELASVKMAKEKRRKRVFELPVDPK